MTLYSKYTRALTYHKYSRALTYRKYTRALTFPKPSTASSFGTEREALQAEVHGLQTSLAEAQAVALASAAQARSAGLKTRLIEQEKKELEEVLKDVDASMPATLGMVRQRLREEDEARMLAMVDEVRKTSQEHVGHVESTLHAVCMCVCVCVCLCV